MKKICVEFGESENIVCCENGLVFDNSWPTDETTLINICVRKNGIRQGNIVKDNHWGWLWLSLNLQSKILHVKTEKEAKREVELLLM